MAKDNSALLGTLESCEGKPGQNRESVGKALTVCGQSVSEAPLS